MKGVCSKAPATPGLLNINTHKIKLRKKEIFRITLANTVRLKRSAFPNMTKHKKNIEDNARLINNMKL